MALTFAPVVSTRPHRGGAAGSSTPAAESPAAPPALGITFLGVRRGRRPVIPPPWACGAFFGAPGVSRVHFLGPRGSLGGSWGSPVALLEGSWGVRGRFRSRLFGYEILRRFFDPILIQKGRPRGGIWEAFWEPRRFQNRSKIHIKIQEQKKRLLNAIWHRFGTCRRAKSIEKSKEKQ